MKKENKINEKETRAEMIERIANECIERNYLIFKRLSEI